MTFFDPEPLDVDFECAAKYSQFVQSEVTDALIEAVRDGWDDVGRYPNFEPEDFLGRLWNRGFKIVGIEE